MMNIFARVHAYSAVKVRGILDEACRVTGACPHVEHPIKPFWVLDTSRQSIEAAIAEHMGQFVDVIRSDGSSYPRARRKDHRCLTAGVLSWPVPVTIVRSTPEAMAQFQRWFLLSSQWVRNEFSDNLQGLMVHGDEEFPHIHFFVVGDAQRLHPGLKAELIDNKRQGTGPERIAAHKRGLADWLDRYHARVGKEFGLTRKTDLRPTWRIKDRQVRQDLIGLQSKIDEREQEKWNEIYDRAEKTQRETMRF